VTDVYGPPSAPVEAPGAPPISAFEALAGVVTSPGDTFGRLLARPTWWLPLVITVVLAAAFGVLAGSRVDWQSAAQEAMDKQAEKSGQAMPPDAADRVAPFMRASAMIATPIMIVVAFFVTVLVLWGAARAFGAEAGFGHAAALWAHASLPNVVGLLFAVPVLAFLGEGAVRADRLDHVLKSNLGAFLPDGTSPALLSLATSMDVFSFATVALLVIGFRRVKGLSEGTATALPIALWVVWILIRAGLAGLRG
jgi:hypothetical protein